MNKVTAGERVVRLLSEQLVGVLCAADDRQPYGFPMVFIVAGDMRSIVFATYQNTRKYQLLTKNPLVAFVVDNRASLGDFDPAAAELVAATGVVTEVAEEAERQRFRVELTRRYPKLATFFNSPRIAIFRLAVARYSLVVGVDETTEFQTNELSTFA